VSNESRNPAFDGEQCDDREFLLDAAYEAELERRVTSVEDGTATVIEMDASIARLRARLERREQFPA
jgi:hypothetical protein